MNIFCVWVWQKKQRQVSQEKNILQYKNSSSMGVLAAMFAHTGPGHLSHIDMSRNCWRIIFIFLQVQTSRRYSLGGWVKCPQKYYIVRKVSSRYNLVYWSEQNACAAGLLFSRWNLEQGFVILHAALSYCRNKNAH